MNTWKTANAVVRHLEATIPVYDVSEQGHSLYVSLVDGRDFIVDAPLEGDVRIPPVCAPTKAACGSWRTCRRTPGCEPRVRDDVGGWDW